MLLAIPICQDRVSPVLDVAARFLLVRFGHGVETGREEVIMTPLSPLRLSQGLTDLGVNTLICGAVSTPMVRVLEDAGVRVIPHICGEVESVLHAFATRTLHKPEFRMPGCGAGCCGGGGHCFGRRCHGRKSRKPTKKPGSQIMASPK